MARPAVGNRRPRDGLVLDGVGVDAELIEEMPHAPLDIVSDGSHRLQLKARRVGQIIPGLIPLPRKMGQRPATHA